MEELECIILAGGMGTRLRGTVPDLPKCLAPVAGRPFVQYLVEELEAAGFKHIIFSLGYMHGKVEEWIAASVKGVRISTVVESSPLGTGGGVKLALGKAGSGNVFVLNGDTWLDVNFKKMLAVHRSSGARATLAVRKMKDFDRYGTVETRSCGGNTLISAFREKRHCVEGFISGGVYVIQKDALQGLPEAFSIEKDYFSEVVDSGVLSAFECDGYFLDIGVPEDYNLAQTVFAKGLHKRYDTLFLDRDGVINRELTGTYVRNSGEFEFLPGVLDALKKLRLLFASMVVVTNQRGVSKGVMSERNLLELNGWMCAQIEKAGGRLDAVYYSTGMDCSDPMRKPNPGMVLKYAEEHPGTDLGRCIMVGDKASDMECAANAGVRGVLVSGDFTLLDFANKLLEEEL